MTDEPVEVQLVENDGQRLKGDQAHIKEFTPLSPKDMQASFQNTDSLEDFDEYNELRQENVGDKDMSEQGIIRVNALTMES